MDSPHGWIVSTDYVWSWSRPYFPRARHLKIWGITPIPCHQQQGGVRGDTERAQGVRSLGAKNVLLKVIQSW